MSSILTCGTISPTILSSISGGYAAFVVRIGDVSFAEMIPPDFISFAYLALSLALGLLVGLERGWEERDTEEGGRIAGLRTFGLIGLTGGASGLLAEKLGVWLPALAFAGLSLLLAAAYRRRSQKRNDVGLTTAVAALLTFMLGALAVMGYPMEAAGSAVVVSLLLMVKPTLHRWIRRLEERELHATLQLLLISVVLLPVLPDKDFGPYKALNLYELWWMVVLITAISYVGYFAIRIGGARRGILLTGAFGGLASSTALTLHLSRLAKSARGLENMIAAGILASGTILYPRVLLVASIIHPPMVTVLAPPLAIMAAGTLGAVAFYWWRSASPGHKPEPVIGNPFQIWTALKFGLLLAVLLLASKALSTEFGNESLLYLAAAAGIADVDAITLSFSRLSGGELGLGMAGSGILIAVSVNAGVKTLIAFFVGNGALGLRAGMGLLLPVLAGFAAFVWLVSG